MRPADRGTPTSRPISFVRKVSVLRSRQAVAQFVALLIPGVVLAGCGGSNPSASTQPGTVPRRAPSTQVVRLLDNGFLAPSTVRGPAVDLEVVNDGTEVHEMEISQVKPGTTTRQVVEALHRHEEPPFMVADTGGVTALGPGERLRYRRHLPPGSYVLYCSLPTADGSDHLSKGMVRLFTVSDSQPGPAPVPDLTVTMGDRAITTPAITAGTRSVALVNRGTTEHEIWITGVPSTQDQRRLGEVDAWFEHGQVGPPPLGAHFPGGHQSISPGSSVTLTMTFRHGYTYHFVDNTGAHPVSSTERVV